MSSRKHTLCPDDIPHQKKCKVMVETSQKWTKENNNEFGTFAWLKYDKVNRKHVATLKCFVRIEFNDKLLRMRNYNSAFVVGTKNLRSSSYKDHAVTNIHKRAMFLSKKQHGSDITDYAPIAKALHTL